MGKKRKGRAQKKNFKVEVEESTDVVQAPHSFVIHRGLPCPFIQDLTKDFRRIMEPFTAIHLKERKSNKIKDFVSLSGVFHVSHMCIFNKTSTQLSFKIARLPRGPTLTFKVHQFTLARDIISSTRKQFIDEESFQHAPLVIMNNFTGEGKHLKLMANTFQNMFPTINLATVNLTTMKRCLLFSYNPVTKIVEIRHYTMTVVPVGLSRGIKKVVLGKVPNLSRCEDVADFITQGTYMSDSEPEDEEASHVVLPQAIKRRGNLQNNKSAIRLHEIGPRISCELIKIEDGLLTGEVLHHEVIVKTEKEVEEIRRLREKKKKLKEQRKKTQAENKLKKDQKNDGAKNKSHKENIAREEKDDDAQLHYEPDNDAEYYKEEVGEEPEEELFSKSSSDSRKRIRLPKHMHAQDAKRRKLDSQDLKGGKKNQFKQKDSSFTGKKHMKEKSFSTGDRKKKFKEKDTFAGGRKKHGAPSNGKFKAKSPNFKTKKGVGNKSKAVKKNRRK